MGETWPKEWLDRNFHIGAPQPLIEFTVIDSESDAIVKFIKLEPWNPAALR